MEGGNPNSTIECTHPEVCKTQNCNCRFRCSKVLEG